MSTTLDPKQGRALVKLLRKQSVCVYLAAEEGPAADLSDGLSKAADTLSWALDRIAALEGQLQEVRAWMWCSQCGQWAWEPSCGPTHAMQLEGRKKLLRQIDKLFSLSQPAKEDA